MNYPSGERVKLRDKVRLGRDSSGIVVGIVESGEYQQPYKADEWSYLKSGVLIEFAMYGLIHFELAEPDLELIARSDYCGSR